MADQEASANHFDTSFWSLASNSTSLVEAISMAQPEKHQQVAVTVVISDGGNPVSMIADHYMVGFDLRESGDARYLWISDKFGDFVVSGWPAGREGIYFVVASVPVTDKRWARLERWIRSSVPRMSFCFLNHSDFLAIGTALTRYGHVELNRMTGRKVVEQSSVSRGWTARAGSIRPNHYEGVAEMEAEGASVKTMSLVVQNRISVHLRRVAGATYYWGNLEIFEREVLERLASAAAERRSLLANRQRNQGSAPTVPVSLRMPAELLGDSLPMASIVDELEKLSDINVAVLHKNPYLHVAVANTLDGSNFDVFITSTDSIEIYAGYRATSGALGALSQDLSDRLQVREITEAPPAPSVGLEDLFTSS